MLEIRPICENCGKDLPNESSEAMICSFECTYCIDCVTGILQNVCPNCGGGFERRPTRPTECVTSNCLENYPVKKEKRLRPVDLAKFEKLKNHFRHHNPRKR